MAFASSYNNHCFFSLEESKKLTIVPDENNPGKKFMINILLFVNLYTANFSEVEKLSIKQHWHYNIFYDAISSFFSVSVYVNCTCDVHFGY